MVWKAIFPDDRSAHVQVLENWVEMKSREDSQVVLEKVFDELPQMVPRTESLQSSHSVKGWTRGLEELLRYIERHAYPLAKMRLPSNFQPRGRTASGVPLICSH